MKKVLMITSVILSLMARDVRAHNSEVSMPTQLPSPVAFSGVSHLPSKPQLKGFYVGAGVGSLTMKNQMTIEHVDENADKLYRNLNGNAPSLHGFLGYEKRVASGPFEGYVLEVEATYFYANAGTEAKNCFKGSVKSFEAKDQLNISHSFGLNVSIGRPLKNITPYMKVGALSTAFEMTTVSSKREAAGTDKKRYFGLSTGIGLRYAMTQRMDLITEVGATYYPSFKSKDMHDNAGGSHVLKVDPWFYMFMIGVRWKF